MISFFDNSTKTNFGSWKVVLQAPDENLQNLQQYEASCLPYIVS